jgi:SAM-dependent methyltransferase
MDLKNKGYVHGYAEREKLRLQDQASTLTDLLHSDTFYPEGSLVLEPGCGVGAQTVTLAERSPGAKLFSVDISSVSVAEAEKKVREAGLNNVQFRQADINDLPFNKEYFDHIFVCFVLEHLKDPAKILGILKEYLRPGGTITVIEGDHGSAFFYPESEAAQAAINFLSMIQKNAGGNALIGRELYPLLKDAGYGEICVSPRMVYADGSRPEMVEGFTKKTFTAMIEGVREQAITSHLIDPAVFEKGIADLYRTAEPDGVFCYTFFKAVARKV